MFRKASEGVYTFNMKVYSALPIDEPGSPADISCCHFESDEPWYMWVGTGVANIGRNWKT
jgi:hypothetical protein